MRLRINHDTIYDYDQPIGNLVQSLRLTPAPQDALQVEDWQIQVQGGQRGAGFRDGAGDWVESWTLRKAVTQVVISVRGLVSTSDTAGVLRGHREAVHPFTYLRDTTATEPDEAIRALASSVEGADGLALAHALSAAVADAIHYTPGATHGATTAAEALAGGEGVCQDHAHVLIAAARCRDLPARYVHGYLYADADGKPHEAAHAWAELHIEGLGWVGFDPANRSCPDERYLRLASGFDAQDAAPIRGMGPGAAHGVLRVQVAVDQAGEGDSLPPMLPEPASAGGDEAAQVLVAEPGQQQQAQQ